jgi:hypothetical protein
MTRRSWLLLALAGLALGACATTTTTRPVATVQPQPSATRHVRGEEFRVVGRPDGQGDAYDATLLFDRANAAVQTRRCDAAIPDYERLVREFPTSRLVAAAHFNRGVCLQSMGRHEDAVAAYREAATHTQDPALARDAWFRAAAVGETAQQPPVVVEATTAVLGLRGLAIVDQVEALARQAAALLAQGDRPGAARVAERAIALAPTAEAVSALGDDTYIAQARFVAAEVSRQDAAAIEVRVEDPQLELAIERRVQLVTHAHVQYNDAIRVGNPHWAAACGYSIGEMYRALYESIVNAPVPADWDARAIGIYRRRTAQRLRPLLQGALRAWEATQAMARRNGISDNAWVRRTDEQIGALRELVLNGEATPPATPASGPAPGTRPTQPSR